MFILMGWDEFLCFIDAVGILYFRISFFLIISLAFFLLGLFFNVHLFEGYNGTGL